MGENLIVGQSGGPTAAINATLAGVFDTAKKSDIGKIYGMRYGIEGFMAGNYIDLSDYIKSDSELELLKHTPSAFLGSCRYKLPKLGNENNEYELIFKRLAELEIGYFLYIGGNDSMDTIKQLSLYAEKINSDIKFIGIPKTIDNDLAITDHTPGFGSAAKFIANTIREIRCDSVVYNLKSATVIEIMGRNAGWLTSSAVLAEDDTTLGADLIYLPERPFDCESFLQTVKKLTDERGNIIIAVSEGIKDKDGNYISNSETYSGKQDSFGHTALGGTAQVLSNMIVKDLGIKSRAIEFSTLQRCSSHIASLCDITEAFQAGATGVRYAIAGESGKMVVFNRVSDSPYKIELSSADINSIANVEKSIPDDWFDENGELIRKKARAYLLPLVDGELDAISKNGIFQQLRI